MRITLEQAKKLLEAGKVVSIPTETVYGLGALLKNPEAIDSIFILKGRPNDNPLIVHVAKTSDVLIANSASVSVSEPVVSSLFRTGNCPFSSTKSTPSAVRV